MYIYIYIYVYIYYVFICPLLRSTTWNESRNPLSRWFGIHLQYPWYRGSTLPCWSPGSAFPSDVKDVNIYNAQNHIFSTGSDWIYAFIICVPLFLEVFHVGRNGLLRDDVLFFLQATFITGPLSLIEAWRDSCLCEFGRPWQQVSPLKVDHNHPNRLGCSML